MSVGRFECRIPASQTEVNQLGQILAQCFNAPPADESVYMSRVGIQNIRVLCDQDRVIGGLGLLEMGQWYGSRVPMVGIGGVGILPEYRGQGGAIALMQTVLQELHTREIPLSVLYSAAQPLYRKAGYEQAGTLCIWSVLTSELEMRADRLPIERVSLNVEEFAPLYQQQASQTNGFLDRNPFIWQGLLNADKGMPLHAYRIGTATQPEGYVIFEHQNEGDYSQIVIRDWVLLTPAAVRKFWAFWAVHRSQVDRIQWRSSAIEALSLVLPEQKNVEIKTHSRWMLRIVHVQKALEQRGYSPDVSAELHLEIRDGLFPANAGKFILTVEKEQATVTKGGRGDLQLDVSSLSPLYTGLFSPAQLQWCDRLTGSDAALAIATQLFAGSPPWMPDAF
ncbi:enhanced intracellular survival protein Eis [Phormidesmis sp. 146-12]